MNKIKQAFKQGFAKEAQTPMPESVKDMIGVQGKSPAEVALANSDNLSSMSEMGSMDLDKSEIAAGTAQQLADWGGDVMDMASGAMESASGQLEGAGQVGDGVTGMAAGAGSSMMDYGSDLMGEASRGMGFLAGEQELSGMDLSDVSEDLGF